MKTIYLHNPSHNGDIFFTLEYARILIESNKSYNFIIIVACSESIYTDILKNNTNCTLIYHPCIWNINMKNEQKEQNYLLNKLHNVLEYYVDNNLYINLWQLLLLKNNYCIGLKNRINIIKHFLNNIKNKYNITLLFNCDNDCELIPKLPIIYNINCDLIKQKLLSHNCNKIFFFNLNSFSGLNKKYDQNFNENFILKLITENISSLIVIVKPSKHKSENLLCLEDYNIKPTLDGTNLICNCNIAILCNDIYIKNNGGSLFICNKETINKKNINIYLISQDNGFRNTIKNEYFQHNTTMIKYYE